MENRSSHKRVIGILIFAIGILLSAGLTAVLTWANFEAEFYGFHRFTSDRLSGLTCPLVLTLSETGTIQIDIFNSTGKTIDPIIRIDTSTHGAADTLQIPLHLLPGQSEHLKHTINADNVDLGNFIFVKVYRYPSYPLPAAESTCGTMILDLPFLNGAQIYLLWLTLCLSAFPLGIWLWSPREDERIFNAAKAAALFALSGLLLSVQVGWALGLFCLILTILLSIVILQQATPR
ncbi:MAG: hypothetical protein WCK35_02885 [Chloroflexota bacterium]